ncbi:MAG: hypothetical protein Fur005_16690 [Roseiflexaceae bacterium]
MPTTTHYHQAEFPAVLRWQAIAFMRIEWPFIFQSADRFMADPYPASLNPVHIVATEGESLLSYAAAQQMSIEHAATTYTTYGFGNMFTFPPYRREGYGRQVLDHATEFIRQSAVDLAMLFCDRSLVAFYAASGWEPMPAPTYLGSPAEQHTHDAIKMILFVSRKGQQGREAFANTPLTIREPW